MVAHQEPVDKPQNGQFPHFSDNVPEYLKAEDAWAVCQPDKIPLRLSGVFCSSTDERTWTTYEKARAAYGAGKFVGLGRMILEGEAGIDLDDCLDPDTGEINQWALRIIRFIDSYTEISPSGTGVKIWVKGPLPESHARKEGDRKIEIYPRARFFTVTGNHLPGTPTTIEERQEELEALVRMEFPESHKREPGDRTPIDEEHGDIEADCEEWGVEVLGRVADRQADIALKIVCPWVDEHTTNPYGGTYLFQFPSGKREFVCRHAHCSDKRHYGEFYREVAPRVPITVGGKPLRTDTSENKKKVSGEVSAADPLTYADSDTTDTSDTFSGVHEISFPIDAQPPAAAEYVRHQARAINCPAELVALPVLGVLSGTIGLSRKLLIKADYVETALLYAVNIAEPGEKKTAAQRAATGPVRKLQGDLRNAHEEKMEDYRQEMRQHAVDKKLAAKEDKPEPKPPERPVMDRILVDDITIEALARRLQENPRGLLSVQDELSGFLRAMDQYKTGGKGDARQKYMKIWSNAMLVVDRRSEEDPIILPEPFLTLVGAIQPAVVGEIGAGRDDGFLDRFLLSYPTEFSGGFSDYECPTEIRDEYYELVSKLWKQSAPVEDGQVESRIIGMSENAKALWRSESLKLAEEKRTPGFPRKLVGAWSKMDSQMARLALIIASARHVEKGGADRVQLQDMEAARRLVEYFKAMARRVYGVMHQADPDDKLAETLVALLTDPLKAISDSSNNSYEYIGTATELWELLPEEKRPPSSDALGRALRRIARKTPTLTVKSIPKGDHRELVITYKKCQKCQKCQIRLI